MPFESTQWDVPFGDRVLPIGVALHPAPSAGAVTVMIPGWDGAIDGWARKYEKVADLLVARGVSAVVRTANHPIPGLAFETSSVDRLRGVVRRARVEAAALCGQSSPQLFVLGVSAGASAAAVCASELAPARLLLLAPSADCEIAPMRAGLAGYTGQLFVAVGGDDVVVGRQWPEEVSRMAPRASRVAFVVVPGCDHQFRGATSGRIFSQAPLWAFADDAPFPDGSRGIHLYE
jgi:hypothetical protein